MARIYIVEDGKVLPGQEDTFEKLARREGRESKETIERYFREEPEVWAEAKVEMKEAISKFSSENEYWLQEGKQGLLSACWRLGCGSISLEEEEIKKL